MLSPSTFFLHSFLSPFRSYGTDINDSAIAVANRTIDANRTEGAFYEVVKADLLGDKEKEPWW